MSNNSLTISLKQIHVLTKKGSWKPISELNQFVSLQKLNEILPSVFAAYTAGKFVCFTVDKILVLVIGEYMYLDYTFYNVIQCSNTIRALTYKVDGKNSGAESFAFERADPCMIAAYLTSVLNDDINRAPFDEEIRAVFASTEIKYHLL